jgi:taurine dioxygenase
VDRPPLGSVFRAVVIPPYGGDTVWANTVTAYEDLPVYLKALAD